MQGQPKPPFGIIGLGLLGLALAERALAAGMEVAGFDIDPKRKALLEQKGGTALASVEEVGRHCRRTLLALPHEGVTRNVLQALAPNLPKGSMILDATTGEPEASVEFARDLDKHGVVYLDATVSGSSAQAREGKALLMVGGAKEAFDECRELFGILAERSIHTGPCGSGAKMKLATNLVLGLNRAALAEGLVFAEALGLDAEKALDAMKASAAYSRAMDSKGEKMIRRDFEPQARLSQHLKDVRLILGAASRAGKRLPLSETHLDLLLRAEREGFGELDNSSIISMIERLPQDGGAK